jgi:uncharacterized repeat protein (TIGR03803 family)
MPMRFLRSLTSALVLTAAMLMLAESGWAQRPVRVIYSFPPSGGIDPRAKLLYVAGRLYGTTQQGGRGVCFLNAACGVVFTLSPSPGGNWTYHQLYAFNDGTDAQVPVGDLVRDTVGNLYGATEYGGTYGFGAVYKLSRDPGGAWTESIIHSFSNIPDGANPHAGLTMDAAGNIYGTTGNGGASGFGTVYQLTQNPDGSWGESLIHNFSGTPDGIGPSAELIFDAAGNIYGTTVVGGSDNTSGDGVVFELSPGSGGGWTESILYTFQSAQLGYPVAPVWMDPSGNLFGTGLSDGSEGSIFELTRNSSGGWSESFLFDFHGGVYGSGPYGGVVPDENGTLYGTTDSGGFLGLGTIYKLTLGSNGVWTRTTAYNFRGQLRGDGSYPAAGLTAGKPGIFYGTTSGDITGTVFEFKP